MSEPNTIKAQIKTALLAALFLSAFYFTLSVFTVEYQCRPYKPNEFCDISKYEIKIFEAMHLREPLAFIEADCVYDLGQRYKAMSVWFHTPPARTEYIEAVELPKTHIEICKVD